MMNKVKSISILAVILIFTINSNVLAAPLSEQLKNQNKQLEQSKIDLKNAQDKREEFEIKLEQFDISIEGLLAKIDKNDKDIDEYEKNIKAAEEKYLEAQKEVDKEQELFNKRVRLMYINGPGSYLEVLLSTKGFSDLDSKIESVKTIIQFDKEILARLNSKKEEVKRQKEYLIDEKDKLLALKLDNENELDKVNASKNEQSKLLEQVKNQGSLLLESVVQSESQVKDILKQINEENNKRKYTIASSSNKASVGNVEFASNDVLAYAAKFLGVPYLWGGTNPEKGLDCSGFTQLVFKNFGISIDRTTYEQIKNGTRITKENLRPGDLVFFGTESDPHHVGIYMGNNYYIHAPRTGDVVKIAEMVRKDFLTGVRVM